MAGGIGCRSEKFPWPVKFTGICAALRKNYYTSAIVRPIDKFVIAAARWAFPRLAAPEVPKGHTSRPNCCVPRGDRGWTLFLTPAARIL
jgi:hypothetical protein